MKILSQLIKTGLGLKLIFGDFSFRELFTTKEEDSYAVNHAKWLDDYNDLLEKSFRFKKDMSKFAYKAGKDDFDSTYETFYKDRKFVKEFKYNIKDFYGKLY